MSAVARLVLLLLVPLVAVADERVLDYHTDILVRQDGRIEVTETITVRSEEEKIRRGIYRDYPTRYKDRFGNDVQVSYEPKSVLRNGSPESFRSEARGNGVRTWFGSPDRLVGAGVHTYEFRYEAGRMLGFFEAQDELYWNVTGLGWEFPIDRASATVRFDFDLPPQSVGVDAWTGPAGGRGSDFRAAVDDAGQAEFVTTEPLPRGHGLTILVDWPKGFVVEPGLVQRTAWTLSDNANLLVALAGLLALLAWYIPVWRRYGRDPEEGIVVTRYRPPPGFSPASLRFIEQMGYDDTTLTAAIVNLAVKGYLRIEKTGKKHVLHRKPQESGAMSLAPGEEALLRQLFSEGDMIELDNSNHELLGKAKQLHRASLQRDYKDRYFRVNGAKNLPAILIAIAISIIALNVGSGASFSVIALIVIFGITIVTFAILLRRPTGIGRKVLDEVAGFREYLEVAEKDEMNLRNPPDKTPELFERYLPFALALGVEHRWAEKFAGVLGSLRGPGNSPYHPAWYSGDWNANSFSRTTSSLTSGLGAAISSSVSPPGSSSGGGGGGSSGGGGGGGGGGGW